MPLTREVRSSKSTHLKPESLKLVADAVTALEQRHGRARPHDLLDAARAPASPLHGLFEWDNDTAAEKYRLAQARRFIAAVQVVYLEGDEEKFAAPAFVSVTHVSADAEGKAIRDRGYVAVEKALADPQTRQQLLDEALRQADYWQQKHRNLMELAPIFDTIRKVRRKLSRRSPTAVAV
jgi:hypothetical protein